MRRYLKLTVWVLLLMLAISSFSFGYFNPPVSSMDIYQGDSGEVTFDYRYTAGPSIANVLWLGGHPGRPFNTWVEREDLGTNVSWGTPFGLQSVTVNVPETASPGYYPVYIHTSFEYGPGYTSYSDYHRVVVHVLERTEIEIEIDVKPDSDENPVNLKSKGKLPVAILTTEEFDASEVDPATVTINGVGMIVKKNGTMMYSMEDVDEDGDMDMMMHFGIEALMIDPGASELELEGEMMDGTPIVGVDLITVVPK